MKSKIMLAVSSALVFVPSAESADDLALHQTTTVPATSRYEIVQSPLLAKLAFKLDRFTGDAWQFVPTTDGGYAWQKIPRIDIPNDKTQTDAVNYQIFLSGLLAKQTILLNTNTGVSWYIAEDPKQGIFWRPMQ